MNPPLTFAFPFPRGAGGADNRKRGAILVSAYRSIHFQAASISRASVGLDAALIAAGRPPGCSSRSRSVLAREGTRRTFRAAYFATVSQLTSSESPLSCNQSGIDRKSVV